MSSWTEKTCQLYFKKWFETTVHIPVKDVETSKIIIRPDYIIGFFSFDLDAATYLVNLFANGNLRNEGNFYFIDFFQLSIFSSNNECF